MSAHPTTRRPLLVAALLAASLGSLALAGACRATLPTLPAPRDTSVDGSPPVLLARALGLAESAVLEAVALPVDGLPPFERFLLGRYQHPQRGPQGAIVAIVKSGSESRLGPALELGPAEMLQARNVVDLEGEGGAASLRAIAQSTPPPRLAPARGEPVRPALFLRLDFAAPGEAKGAQVVLVSLRNARLRIVWRATLFYADDEGGFTSTRLELSRGPRGIVDLAVTHEPLDPQDKGKAKASVRRYRYVGGRYVRIR